MYEATRKDYLTAMGITPMYLRTNLPHAKESPEYQFDPDQELLGEAGRVGEAESSPFGSHNSNENLNSSFNGTTPRTNSTPQGLSSNAGSGGSRRPSTNNSELQGLRESLQNKPQSRKTRDTGQPAMSSSIEGQLDNPAQVANQLQFTLRYYQIDTNTIVLSEEPFGLTADPTRLALERQAWETLLINILAAINVSTDRNSLVARSELFQWPIANMPMPVSNDPEKDGEAIARSALQGYLSQKLNQQGSQRVVAFAGRTAGLLRELEGAFLSRSNEANASSLAAESKDSAWSEEPKGSSLAAAPKGTAGWIITESLPSMISVPLLKRGVWEALKNAL